MQKILKAPTLIGIRRTVLKYSFENFTISDKKTAKFAMKLCRSWVRLYYCIN